MFFYSQVTSSTKKTHNIRTKRTYKLVFCLFFGTRTLLGSPGLTTRSDRTLRTGLLASLLGTLVASLLLVVRPGDPSSVLVWSVLPNSAGGLGLSQLGQVLVVGHFLDPSNAPVSLVQVRLHTGRPFPGAFCYDRLNHF